MVRGVPITCQMQRMGSGDAGSRERHPKTGEDFYWIGVPVAGAPVWTGAMGAES